MGTYTFRKSVRPHLSFWVSLFGLWGVPASLVIEFPVVAFLNSPDRMVCIFAEWDRDPGFFSHPYHLSCEHLNLCMAPGIDILKGGIPGFLFYPFERQELRRYRNASCFCHRGDLSPQGGCYGKYMLAVLICSTSYPQDRLGKVLRNIAVT